MKSFARQIAQLFSFAGYKSNEKLLPCSVTYSPLKNHHRLTYRCDIALKIYDHYKQHGFKYSEKGVTPRSIAEEIELFVLDSKDFEVSIDSFGHFNVTPSNEYYQKVEKQFQSSQPLRHVQVNVPSLKKQKWHSQNKRIFFIPMQSFTLSDLRIAYYLRILKKKCELFNEYTPENIITYLDSKNLVENDFKTLIKLDIVNSTIKTVSWNGQRLLVEKTGKIAQFSIDPKDEVITGTLRHNYIPFINKYQSSFLNDNSKILTFGDIIPNKDVDQIQKVEFDFIPKILTQSLRYQINVPINLLSNENPQSYRPEELLNQLSNRSNYEKLLIMLDYLQDDKIIPILALKNIQISKNNFKPFSAFFEQLQQIL